MSSPGQEHFQANITIITCLKYDDYSNCITFAGESVFQALIIITILNILDHAYRNFSNYIRELKLRIQRQTSGKEKFTL